MSERKMIYLCLAHMSENGMEQKYVKEAFDTNWVVPMGPNVNAFEADLANMANCKLDGTEPLDRKVVCLSAGTAAVHLALIACGVKAGDEVLVQSFTFCASSHPITYLGAKPVFIDSERDTWNMDPELCMYNADLAENIYINHTSLVETAGRASLTYLSTLAVLQLDAILQNAKLSFVDKPKPGNKQQSKFEKMIGMEYSCPGIGDVQLMVGVRKRDKMKIQYCITALTPIISSSKKSSHK